MKIKQSNLTPTKNQYVDRFHWEDPLPDPRSFKPTMYKDVTLTYQEINGFTRNELKQRNQAPRLSPSFTTTPKTTCELNKSVPFPNINDIDPIKSGLRANAEPSISKLPVTKQGIATLQQLYNKNGNSKTVLRDSTPGSNTTPLHDLCASTRLLTLTGLSGTMKRNPLACYQTDTHHRTPLHWLVLNPKLNATMLFEYLNFNNGACKQGLRIVDSHGESSMIDYFLDAHKRIGFKEWKKCLDIFAKNSMTEELLYDADPFYNINLKAKGKNLSALPLMALGGRVSRIRCDAPLERQHLQGNAQMMSNQMISERTTEHPDEIKGYEMRSSDGHAKTKVGDLTLIAERFKM